MSYAEAFSLFAAINLLTFCAYARDKFAAIRGHWRTSEKTLIALSFIGGIGAIAGIAVLKHKNRKTRYLLLAVPTVIMGLTASLWFIARSGFVGR